MTEIVEQAKRLGLHDANLYQIFNRIEALQQQLAEEHEAHLIAEQKWLEEMAACHAREKVLRDALEYYMTNGVDEHLYYTVKKALSQPTDDTALKAALAAEFSKGYTRGYANYEEGVKLALAAERERCIGTCKKVGEDGAGMAGEVWVDRCVDAIRALENK